MQRNVNRSSDLSFGVYWVYAVVLDFGCGFGCEVHLEIALQSDLLSSASFTLAVSALH